MRLFTRVALATLLFAPSAAAQAVDQLQPWTNTYFWGPYPFAQSFTPDSSTIIGASAALVGIDPDNNPFDGSTAQVTINLWDLLPNDPGATLLAGGSVLAVADQSFASVIWDPVTLSPGATYFLEFVLHETTNLAVNVSINGNAYMGGTAWNRDPDDPSAPWQVVENFDFAFLTWSTSSPVESTVPEPATITLLATGIAAMGAARRRQRPRR